MPEAALWPILHLFFHPLNPGGVGRQHTATIEHKPFVLPQSDPAYYDTFTDSYNAAELVSGEVALDWSALEKALSEPAIPTRFANPPPAASRAEPANPVRGSSDAGWNP